MTISGQVQQMALVQTVLRGGYEVVVDSLQLAPMFGPYGYTSLDLGTPAIDSVIGPLANSSGTYDQSKYTRERAVAIDFTLFDNWQPQVTQDSAQNYTDYWVRQMAKWCSPAMRCYLYFQVSGAAGPTYRMDLRGNGMPQPIALADRQNRFVQMNFISPTGVLRQFSIGHSDADTAVTRDGRLREVLGFLTTSLVGLTFPVTFPVTFPGDTGSVGGHQIIYGGSYDNNHIFTSNGAIPAGFIARIRASGGGVYQPKLNFVLTDPTGYTFPAKSIGFQTPNGATVMIPDGHYLEINTETMTARLDGDPNQPMEPYLLGSLRWPKLSPGTNLVQFTFNANADGSAANAPGSTSITEILYYPTFL